MFECFNGMFGKLAPGMCRLSMSGKIAVKTKNGYKAYDVKKNVLTNCDNFVLPVGDDFFFCLPTNKVEIGDIIIANGKPKCVTNVTKEAIQVVNYEDSTVENILPERHEFMGNTYFYGKIVSLLGNNFTKKGKDGANNIIKYMMMGEMFKGGASGNNMLPLLLMNGGGFGDMFNFDGLFGACEDEDTDEVADLKEIMGVDE